MKQLALPGRALTVRQPYAELILTGRKPIETRTWSTTHRGPLAIHAAGQVDRDACRRLGYAPDLQAGGRHYLPRGALVGHVDLVDVLPLERADEDAACCPWSPGRFAWILASPRRLEAPLPMPGKLGLWRLPS